MTSRVSDVITSPSTPGLREVATPASIIEPRKQREALRNAPPLDTTTKKQPEVEDGIHISDATLTRTQTQRGQHPHQRRRPLQD